MPIRSAVPSPLSAEGPAARDTTRVAVPWTEARLLDRLRSRGADRLERVRFRANRRTLWSLTDRGRALNLHDGYRTAPPPVMEAFAALVVALHRGAGRRSPAVRRAADRVRAWPDRAPGAFRRAPLPGPCCASEAQRRALRAEYRHLNATRFGGLLPDDVPLRLSRRMTRRLGHMRGHVEADDRYVVEIALSLDLMLDGNDAVRTDTLLHEMAHAADWLVHGGRGHGPGWKAWARRVGCRDRACTDARLLRRRRSDASVPRVPPPPAG